VERNATGAQVTAAESGGLGRTYEEQGPKLWRALVAYTGDRHVADDALGEAFAQAAARGPALRVPERWVWTAAFRIAAGELKQRRLRQVPDRSEGVDPSEAVELLLALRQLPPKQRAALVLHYYGGYKAREIAGILGSTATTVRVHLSAGRKQLRKLLEVTDD
jgi:RNA polymerase sigma-70 factor (ECF subfamily)